MPLPFPLVSYELALISWTKYTLKTNVELKFTQEINLTHVYYPKKSFLCLNFNGEEYFVKSINRLNMVYILSETCSTCSNCQFFEDDEPLKIRIWQSAPHWLDYVWYIRCLLYSFHSTSWLIRYVNLLLYRDQIDFFLKKSQTQVWKCVLWIRNDGLNSENMNFVCQVKYLCENYWDFINFVRQCLCLARVRMPIL